MQHAIKAIAAFCRLQKSPRIYVEKTLVEILHSTDPSSTMNGIGRDQPGDRDDNLWITYNNYRPPASQTEWEEMCFLDKAYHGYFQWRKTIKYSLNKRERYISDQMPKNVAIIFDRFINKDFVAKLTKVIILDEDETQFEKIRFLMYKVNGRNIIQFNIMESSLKSFLFSLKILFLYSE